MLRGFLNRLWQFVIGAEKKSPAPSEPTPIVVSPPTSPESKIITLTDAQMKNEKIEVLTLAEVAKLPKLSPGAYIAHLTPLARQIEKETGIYWKVAVVQSAHESGWGNSGLARKACNLFGFTLGSTWTGKSIYLPTWEWIGGKRVDMKRGFRAYNSWYDSLSDWARVLSRLKIYSDAYKYLQRGEDGAEQAIEAMSKHYATDPLYAKKLITMFHDFLP